MMALKLFLLLFAAILPSSVAEVFYVTPTTSTNPSCSSPCHTLDQYAQDHTLFGGHTNITMVFLSGQHYLSYGLTISGVDELTLQGRKNCTHGNEILVNLQLVRIHLDVSTYVMICDMTLRSRLIQQRIEISGPGIDISLLNLTLNLVSLNIQRAFSVQINECKGLSTLYFANTANINITNMDTLGNGFSPLKGIEIDSRMQTTLMITNSTISKYCYGVYSKASTQVTMSITNSQFKDNRFGIYSMYSQGGIIITDTHFERNNYGILVFAFQGHITITATQFRGNVVYGIHCTKLRGEMRISSNTQFNGNRSGSGVLANDTQCMVINNTHFKMNSFGVYAFQLQNLVILNSTVTDSLKFGILLINTNNSLLTDSYVLNNRAGITSVGSSVQVQNTSITNNAFGMIVPAADLLSEPGDNNINAANQIQNCNFSCNNLSGLTLINSQEKVIIQDSIFNKNNGSSIFAYKSTFELIEETVFRDNTANRGGALSLYNSTVTFGPGSNTQFVNNTALEYGGAIYIVSLPAIFPAILIDFENLPDEIVGNLLKTNGLLQKNCFFIAGMNMKVNFMGNKANLGGLDIYGPSLYTNDCSLEEQFIFDTEVAQTLQVTSDPSRVCFCDSDYPQCTSTAFLVINKRKFPGESFSIPVALTGYNFGRVAGTVYTNVVDLDYRDVINETQHVQSVSNIMNCTELHYSIFSHQSQIRFVVLTLTAQDQFTQGIREFETSVENFKSTKCTNFTELPCTARLTTPVYINVTLEECPLGFALHNTTGTCGCDRRINNLSQLTCEIKDQTGFIVRKGTLWIGEDTRQNNTDLYYWHTNCPRDYCDRSETMVDLREPDTQCRLNRGGVLCGSCQNGYSLNLGSNNCTQCNNKTIALLIIFAAFGILLVVLIATLDLTVASGTINGLIFYANIVWINNAILFPAQEKLTVNGSHIITVLIAWINLDFGIETCFSENLNQLTKSGMQFVFPVYIWCIAGLIILICHYSTRATKLFGNNSVAVLATLFLLSYGKLSRNITDVFTHAGITDSEGERKIVWALDGNVRYDEFGHIVLIVVGLIFLFFLLSFTVMILMVPFLISKSNSRLFRWINRLKPFLDTFYGPLKHSKRYQVWIGIMLFSRVVILITSASIPTNKPNVNILLVIVISTLLQAYTSFVGLMYKKLYISLLEGSFLLNLIILGGAFLSFQTPPRNNSPESEKNINPVPTISVSIVLLQLIGIVIFHIVRRVLTKQRLQECLKRESKPEEVSLDTDKDNPTVHVIDANEIYDSSRFRESLLA